MRIRNPQGKPLAWREVDPDQPPSIVKDEQAGRDIILNWSGALGDDDHLRQCPVCQGTEFFTRKEVPQVTAFVLILIAAAISVKLFAADQTRSAVIVLVVVVIVDLLIYFFASRRVVCYACRSEFAGIPITVNQKPWEATTGERYRKLAQSQSPARIQTQPADTSPVEARPAEASPSSLDTRADGHE